MQSKNNINIFDYFDYREYLGDYFEYLKARRVGYSFRLFSIEAEIPSHNFLPRILNRKRNLCPGFIPALSKYLKLSAREERYLQMLVAFNNAKRPSEREKHLKQILSLRLTNEEYRIEDKKLQFFDKWYYPVIKELAVILDFKDDFNKLARSCVPRITPSQAKNAVNFLVKNGFLIWEKDGTYRAAKAIVSTDREVDSAIVPKYHKATLKQCVEALESVKKEDRNYSSLTLLLSKELYEEFKEEIYHFRKKLLTMARNCKDPNMVCFTGFQLLPRSEIVTKIQNVQKNESS